MNWNELETKKPEIKCKDSLLRNSNNWNNMKNKKIKPHSIPFALRYYGVRALESEFWKNPVILNFDFGFIKFTMNDQNEG